MADTIGEHAETRCVLALLFSTCLNDTTRLRTAHPARGANMWIRGNLMLVIQPFDRPDSSAGCEAAARKSSHPLVASVTPIIAILQQQRYVREQHGKPSGQMHGLLKWMNGLKESNVFISKHISWA